MQTWVVSVYVHDFQTPTSLQLMAEVTPIIGVIFGTTLLPPSYLTRPRLVSNIPVVYNMIISQYPSPLPPSLPRDDASLDIPDAMVTLPSSVSGRKALKYPPTDAEQFAREYLRGGYTYIPDAKLTRK